MSDNQHLDVFDTIPRSAPSAAHNVQGWERAGSVATGIVMVGKGLRRGGLFGLIQVAIGGVALARGLTGHSATKALIEQSRQEFDGVRAKIERAGEELSKLQESALKATKTATVTGNEDLKSPKA
ncbi:YgaP family membrane protein [Pseudomonas sp. TE3610]